MGIGGLIGMIMGKSKAPKVSSAASDEVEDVKKKKLGARSKLFSTEGGILGQELDEGQVQKRGRLFGN